jgi:hypothetical protein
MKIKALQLLNEENKFKIKLCKAIILLSLEGHGMSVINEAVYEMYGYTVTWKHGIPVLS